MANTIHFIAHKNRFSVPEKVFEPGGKAYGSTLNEIILFPENINNISLDMWYIICKYLNSTSGVNIHLPNPFIPTNEWKSNCITFLTNGIALCRQLKLSGLEKEFGDYQSKCLDEVGTQLFSFLQPKIDTFEERICNSNIKVCSKCGKEYRKYQTVEFYCQRCHKLYT